MKKIIGLTIIILGMIGVVVFFPKPSVEKVEATQGHQEVCFCHNIDNNPHTICTDNNALKVGHTAHVLQGKDSFGACQEPTPTPTEEPTPTPTDEPEPTPTDEPEPTPTDVPETKGGGNPPTFAGSSTEAPVCSDTKPSSVANIYVKQTGEKGELEVQWSLPTGGDKAHIEYGLEKNAQHALLNTPNDGNEVIKNLVSGKHYWFRVAGVNGCAVGEWSDWYDPIVP